MSFHSEGASKSTTYEQNHQRKALRVQEGRAHAALVFAGGVAVGWCQFGPTEELPHIKHRRDYTTGLTDLPDWRITCFFVDREHRSQGVASAALAGALEQIAILGGGMVESYPEDVSGRKVSSTFIHNATLSLFDETTLYGRYWGAIEPVSGLHFEACYYTPIEFCIARGLQVFEGGAQGEHKLARGFAPVRTTSLHWLAHPEFAEAVERYLSRESQHIASYLDELHEHLPFRAHHTRSPEVPE